ncbi:MAG: TldD/PmbA family protein [Promethearchaeia archaeon]
MMFSEQITDQLKLLDSSLIKELNGLASGKIGYWDLRCETGMGTLLEFTNGKSKEISAYDSVDLGIRTFKNGGWGFVVLKDLSREKILNSFSQAIKLAKFTESLCKTKFQIQEQDPIEETFEIKPKKNLLDTGIEAKIDLVKEHEKTASEFSEKIKNTRSLYMDSQVRKLFLNSWGSNIQQDLSLLRMYCMVYAQKEQVLQKSSNSVGGLGGFEIAETPKAKKISKKSAKEAIELLSAKSPTGGKFTVIMDPELTGTFIHEAFGHAAEADHILSKESILVGKIGKKVALDNVTIIDNPQMGRGEQYGLPYELYGSYYIDDEGIPAQETKIIEDGILKNYLHNLETASRMNEKPNGHGRASSAAVRPQVRMGITTLKPGDWSLEEIIEDTKQGILCKDFQYGYCDPSTGNFQFKCKLSYRIENGEKKEMMRDVALSGMTLEVLNKITALGKESNFSDGTCGKGGQSVRVCDGGPYLRAKNMTVGGLS